MSLRFQRRIKRLPGVRLNLGMHGAGLSVGPRGLHVGVNCRGMYTSAGIPGTGLYAMHHFRTGEGEHHVRGATGGWGGALIVVAVILRRTSARFIARPI